MPKGHYPHQPRGRSQTVKCAYCKAPLTRSQWQLDNRGHAFCNAAHSAAYAHKRAGHGSLETVPCDWCGKELERYTSQIKEHNFCERAEFFLWKRAGGLSLKELKAKKKPAK